MAVAVALVWSATASTKLSAVESETASVGPTSCEQPRLADAIRTFGNSSSVELAVDWQPILRVATDWGANISQVDWSFEEEIRIAQNEPSASEEIAAGDTDRDPCYVNEPLATLRANIEAPSGMFPEDIAARCRANAPARQDERMVDGWTGFDKHWSATCMRHRPLYFEEINAERYGYTYGYCIQPFMSAGHFLATIPTLPYQIIANPPSRCIYTLGHYRPGSCVPYRHSRLPCSACAGIFEAAVIVGLVALIP